MGESCIGSVGLCCGNARQSPNLRDKRADLGLLVLLVVVRVSQWCSEQGTTPRCDLDPSAPKKRGCCLIVLLPNHQPSFGWVHKVTVPLAYVGEGAPPLKQVFQEATCACIISKPALCDILCCCLRLLIRGMVVRA